jgi:alginate O-acetyltransferase complex protein AlgI
VTNFSFSLGAPLFWVFLAGAVLVLVPLTNPAPRRVARAVLNIGFIGLLAGPLAALASALFAATIGELARVGASRNAPRALRVAAVAVGGVVTLCAFVVRKLTPEPLHQPQLQGLGRLLAALGFSYVALRVVELLRAGVDGRARSSGWMDAINYLFPFHMLAAGPIQAWDDFRADSGVPARLGSERTLYAVDRIVGGLFKKFVLARAIEVVFLTGFRAPWPYLLFEIQAYYVWVYLDFSAYSDVAVGTGRLLGMVAPENFDHPLSARNIIVFWERWHISLSTFVRRNVFIPLQLLLMRRAGGAHALLIGSCAFVVSFLIIGLWHGLAWRYVLWGLLHAAALIACNLYRALLTARLGRKGVVTYMTHPVYRILATLITFEFVAASLAFIAFPATGSVW